MGIKGDICGGITAGVIALPLALAFGIASGLGAGAGVWGAIVLGFFAAVFGGTKMQISGPTGPMSVISAVIVFKFANDINAVMAIFVLAGILQIMFGIFRFGKFIKFIPYSVVSGFMNGVGAIIILLQINPMLGQKSVSNTIGAISEFSNSLLNLNPVSLIITLFTLAILYLSPKRLSSILPPPLMALILITSICVFFNISVDTISHIPTGFPKFVMPVFDIANIVVVVTYALILAVLGSIDSLLTSLVADSLTNTKHNSNKELFGQGVGNALVGFVGGIPGAGATMRTVANIKAGGMGRLSGVTHSLFLLFSVLIFAPIVSYVPLAVLAGILIKVGIDIFDYRMLKRIFYMPKRDVFVMVVVFLITIFIDLIFAVFVGVVLAWLFYRFSLAKQDRKFEIKILDKDDTKFIKIIGPMFFGNTAKIMQSLSSIGSPKYITIDCSRATFMDISFVYALEHFTHSIDKTKTRVDVLIDEMFNASAINELKHIMGDVVVAKRDTISDDEVI